MIQDVGDQESIRVMKTELKRLEAWIKDCPTEYPPAYQEAVDRTVELRQRLGLPAIE